VVSEHSDDLFVVDLAAMQKVARIDIGTGTGVAAHHMAALSADAAKVYVAATARDEVTVVDARALDVVGRIPVGAHPTHLVRRPGTDEIWVMNEADDSVSVIDARDDRVVHTLEHDSFTVPHFVRFSGDRAYVANIGGNQISVVDLDRYEVVQALVIDGREEGACAADPCGFADAQIDPSGVLLAAHIETGRVLVYDTHRRRRSADIAAGDQPWAVFVDPFEAGSTTSMMPNWGDASVSIIDRARAAEVARSFAGDPESYGVNFSPLAPDRAYVLNRVRKRVAVVARDTGALVEAIELEGAAETAATTSDGRHLLVPLSTADALAVIDMASGELVASFDDVGAYPWSVVTPRGQNYCH